MRVLVANYHARPVGGVETYLRALLPLLAPQVGALALLTREGGDPGADGVPAAGVEWLPDAGHTPEALADRAARWRPDVVYTHGLGPAPFEAALAARFPTVAFMHNYAGTCASGTKSWRAPADAPCRRALGPSCLALWGPRRCGGTSPVTMLRMYRDAQAHRHALRSCRAVVVASRHMADEMVRNGLPSERVHHVPLFPTAFDADPDAPAPRPPQGRVLFVGRLTALKGWRHLVEALPRAARTLGRPLTLFVAGDGPDRGPFEDACRAADLPAHFLGWTSREQLQTQMRTVDLLAVPSVWPEPFGLVGVEAGCVGLPAVAYAVGGIPEWLVAGESGELAPGDTPEPAALAAAVERAMHDPDAWQRLRVGAWRTARRFTAAAHVAGLLAVLRASGSPS